MDPLTIAAIAAGGQALIGGAQALFSGRKNAEKNLNSLAQQSPLYTPNKSIQDYYQEAMNRYNQNPYQSAQYQAGQNAIQRGTASALNNLQGRGAAIAGAGRLALGQDMALTNLGTQAEAQRRANFGQYGQAAQQQAGEQAKAFQINQEDPYLRKFGLAQYAAQAANARQNAGLQTAASGLGNLGSAYMASVYSSSPKAIPQTQQEANLASQKSFDAARANLPTIENAPRTNAMSYQPYIGDVTNPYIGNGKFKQSGIYSTLNYNLPILRDYTNMTIPQ
jgi:hypothetical protein